jgi:hypothetical protein
MVELGTTQILRWYQSLSKIRRATSHQTTQVTLQIFNPGGGECVKSLKLDEI